MDLYEPGSTFKPAERGDRAGNWCDPIPNSVFSDPDVIKVVAGQSEMLKRKTTLCSPWL